VTGPVAGLVLAAGGGRRLGRPKAVVEVAGARLVDRAVALLQDGGCSPVCVVSGAVDLAVTGATVVRNADWQTGMASSFRTGLAALDRLPPAADGGPAAVVVALVDTPLVGTGAVRRLRSAHADGAVLAVATYGGRRGHPVLLDRGLWAEAAQRAAGDAGARALMSARPALVTEVPCDGTGSPDDVDTPGDLARLRDG
jgi:CTP:molybdopterin cytidylyltransferase MocA